MLRIDRQPFILAAANHQQPQKQQIQQAAIIEQALDLAIQPSINHDFIHHRMADNFGRLVTACISMLRCHSILY